MDAIEAWATNRSLKLTSRELADQLDAEDALANFRKRFHVPLMKTLSCVDKTLVDPEEECVYLCGNSLGLQPKTTQKMVQDELHAWAIAGVTGHFPDGPSPHPWVSIGETASELMAPVVGAKTHEVAVMNTLTVNLHLLMVPFYTPTPERFKILVEAKAFPSDHYAVISQIQQRGYNPSETLIEVTPRQGETIIHDEDILSAISEHGKSIALVLIGGVHYYTGQFFDIPAITKAAHAQGCRVGFDLAHAAGNVELHLHDWDVDFACWCTYKYLNSGPGAISGAFVHERHDLKEQPSFAGHYYSDKQMNQISKKKVPVISDV
eukprot:gene9822-2015_t